MRSRSVFGVAAIVLTMLISACSPYDDNVTIRLAHGLDTKHPVHEALVYMQQALDKKSAGTMQLEIFSSGQLGSEREVVELIQIGTLGMTKVSASSLEAFVPKMKVFSLPYLFRDADHYWEVLEGQIGQSLLSEGEQYRIKGLGYFDAGSRSFYTTKLPITTPDDLAGLKIRVMNSQTAVNTVNAMGGAATPVNWGELYTALQQGIVDGAENNPPSFYFSKHYEVSKYYLLDEHTSIPDVIIVGTHLWSKLDEQQRQWLTEAMQEATEFQRTLWQQSTQMALREVEKAGVVVKRADKSLFQASVAPLYQHLSGTPLAELVTEIQAVGEK